MIGGGGIAMPGREKGGLIKGLNGVEEIEEGASQRIVTGERGWEIV